MPRLVHRAGLLDESAFPIAEGAITLGRSAECGICVQHQSLSRRHAQIERQGGRVSISDLQSKNGVLVNGTRVERLELRDGDIVQVGDVILRFDDPAAPPAPPRARDSTPAPQPGADVEPAAVVDVTAMSIDELLSDTQLGALRLRTTEREQRAQQKLQILLRITQILSSPEHIDRLLERIVDLVFQVLDIDRAALLLCDERTGRLDPRVIRDRLSSAPGPCPSDPEDDTRRPSGKRPIYSQQIIDYVREKSVGALFADAAADPRLSASRSVQLQAIRASMCVPLRPRDKVIGVLYVDNLFAPHRFSEEDLEFLAAFAGQAAIALENAALYRRLEAESIARAQLVLQEKLASLSGMITAIAHELKNPLNLIANFAEVSTSLVEEIGERLEASAPAAPDPPDSSAEAAQLLRENLGKIEAHARRAGEVITQMQLHARSGARAREEIQLDELVAQSVAAAQCAARLKGVDFEVQIQIQHDPALAPVEGVRVELGRALVSVLDNALLAVRDQRRARGHGYQPRITITTAARAGRAELRIRDNGAGIPPDVAPRVFDPFFTTRPSGQGAGLGLSISYDVVVQGHRGEMRITSEPGDQTEVLIALPLPQHQYCVP